MDERQFRALLDLVMCSDPWPEGVEREPIVTLLNFESVMRGYGDWISAYHNFTPEKLP